MNHTDKMLLTSVAIASAMGYLFLNTKKKSGNPVSVLGLDPNNSVKLVAGIAILSTSILVISSINKKGIAI